ncbi:general secretion pathway protein D [Synechococcus sp. CS-1329]|nr:general secretion pathway protein D [Synechococcus sp. CS-1329]
MGTAPAALGLRSGVWVGAASSLLAGLPWLVSPAPALAQAAMRQDGLQLRLRRLSDALELVIQNAGTGNDLRQQMQGQVWVGDLRTAQVRGLRVGPQSLSMPDAGVDSISLDGSGTEFQLRVTPLPGRQLAPPVVSSNGLDLLVRFEAPQLPINQSATIDLKVPGRVPSPSFVPPLRPRAVAPPSGDIAVGTMTIRNRGYLSLYGPAVSLTTRGANPRDVLMVLAQMGGYGFAFAEAPAPPVTVVFQNEPYERAFNFVLLSSGLQARKEGNTILVGADVLGKTIGPQMSKVYRLNQVAPNSAADYLANLGAQVTKTSTITTAVSQGVPLTEQPAGSGISATSQSTTSTQQTVEAFGASSGPLVGLRATTDPRLGTITIVGEPSLVAIGEHYLKQLDLRQRQVALSVKILDVTLANDTTIDNSFAFRYGNNFIVNDGGRLLGAFDSLLPPTAAAFNRSNLLDGALGSPTPIANPGLQYPRDTFFDFLSAQIQSENAKVLASPTLILSENPETIQGGADVGGGGLSGDSGPSAERSGLSPATIGRTRANESFVTVGRQVVTKFNVTSTANVGVSCEPTFSTAGLTFGARVSKIDDNGFVTFTLSPAISGVVDRQMVPGCGEIDILRLRRLDTGSVRVRDGQTLILTGVISDEDFQVVSKWPILGDLPLLGQFFRKSTGSRNKNELVILVTPRIIDDEQGGSFGYGYQPSSPEARRLMYGP